MVAKSLQALDSSSLDVPAKQTSGSDATRTQLLELPGIMVLQNPDPIPGTETLVVLLEAATVLGLVSCAKLCTFDGRGRVPFSSSAGRLLEMIEARQKMVPS